ncbi:MAG: hypothetical protein WAK17_28005 [Candidatus Nitrosopolaris sp.]
MSNIERCSLLPLSILINETSSATADMILVEALLKAGISEAENY